ncbi:hypothetical protein BGZ51_001740 [Haplosporangium sp. Z 767]|nr:hypothetical protein BGZ51_001740 [Haplosporangium sp. Z 767]
MLIFQRKQPAVRTKFTFSSSSSVYKKVGPQDLEQLSSQEIIYLAIYVMKRSPLEFAEPLTCEQIHIEASLRRPSQILLGGGSSATERGFATAADIYLSPSFHIGRSVLHNPSFPVTRPVQSVLAIAMFCARASSLKGCSDPAGDISAPDVAATIVGTKWLAKLGHAMFGGPCSHAGHYHHRRTRASFEPLTQQDIGFGRKAPVELQQYVSCKQGKESKDNEEIRSSATSLAPSSVPTPTTLSRQSSRGPSPGTLSHSTSRSTLSTTATTRRNLSRSEKWCRHCSRAMSCLVIAALQESGGGLRAEDIASFEDSGFGYSSTSGFKFLNAISSRTLPSPSYFSEIGDNAAYSSIGSTYLMRWRDHRMRQELTSGSGSGYGFKEPLPTSPSILSSSPADASESRLVTNVDDSNDPSNASNNSNTKETTNTLNNTLKPTNENQHSPIEDSDLNLVSGPGSAFPSTAATAESPSKSTDTEESMNNSTSPCPVPMRSLSGLHRPRTRLEVDLADAAATLPPDSSSTLSARLAGVGNIHPLDQESLQEPTEASSARADGSGSTSLSSAFSGKPTAPVDDSNNIDESVNDDSRVDDVSIVESQSSSQVLSGSKSETQSQADLSIPMPISLDTKSSASLQLHQEQIRDQQEEQEEEHEEEQKEEKEQEEQEENGKSISDKATNSTSSAPNVQESSGEADPGAEEMIDPSNQESEAASASPLEAKSPVLTTNSKKLFNDVAQDDASVEVSASSSISGSGISLPSPALAASLKPSFFAPRRENNDEEGEEEKKESQAQEQGLNQEEQQLDIYSSPRNTRPLSSDSSTSTIMTDDSQQSSSFGDQDSANDDDTDESSDSHALRTADPAYTSSSSSSFSSSSSSSSSSSTTSLLLTTETAEPLARHERKLEQKRQRRRHKRRLLIDDAKRKQEQLEQIKAQLELRTLGKIRQQVSFWEEKGVLEQKVVATLEVDDDDEEININANTDNNDSFGKQQQDEPQIVSSSGDGPSTSMNKDE